MEGSRLPCLLLRVLFTERIFKFGNLYLYENVINVVFSF